MIEVGPRDGLQNEKVRIAPADKATLIRALAAAGLDHIEVGSFVNPGRVPQMAEMAATLEAVGPLPGVRAMALVPNLRRLDQFLTARTRVSFDLSDLAVFVSATESFSEANLRCSIAESLGHVREIITALPPGIAVRGYLSCTTDCPFEGQVAPDAVARVASELKAAGCETLAVADTIGRGTPGRVSAMLDAVLTHWPAAQVAAHFHDTGGRALANVDAALAAGITQFDGSIAGLGGCPYAPGAPGNVATEALVAHLEGQGFQTDIDRDKLKAASLLARTLVKAPHVA
ncbi:MAG: hydroxymethylglutaryl-CoA lyase [Pseudomonadota bacterium]